MEEQAMTERAGGVGREPKVTPIFTGVFQLGIFFGGFAYAFSMSEAMIRIDYALPSSTSAPSSCSASVSVGVEPTCLLLPPLPVETVRIFPATQ